VQKSKACKKDKVSSVDLHQVDPPAEHPCELMRIQ